MIFRRTRSTVPTTCPPLEEIEAALSQLRAPGCLCFVRAWSTNQGLAAELSFNEAEAETPSGKLEICLREARIDIASPQASSAWTWNEEFLSIADGRISSIEQSFGAARHIEVQHRSDAFRIRFSAYPLNDLAALNTNLARLPLVNVPEPAALDLTQVTMDLSLRLDDELGEVRHAFRIRNASGAWRPLVGSLHKQILAELLLSKFLHPLHDRQRLWPHAMKES
jgi:hypothetical protein